MTEINHSEAISGHAETTWNWISAAGKVRAERRAQLLVQSASITAEDTVLELGCGTGIFTEKICKLTKSRITAIDISPAMTEAAKRKNISADFIVADAMHLPFPEGSFDVVCGSSVLHHMDIKAALEEIFRVLKKGGRIAFAEPNMLNPQIFLQKKIPWLKKLSGDTPGESAIIRWKLAGWLKAAGFTDVRVVPHEFLHPQIPALLVAFIGSAGMMLEKIPVLKEIAGSVLISAVK